MNPQDIKQLLTRTPFKPFTLVMSNNERHSVDHPEMLIVGKSILALGIVGQNGGSGGDLPLADYVIWLSPEHVLKIEPRKQPRAKGK